MIDRSALIGLASTWANWAIQVALFGTGAVLYHAQGWPMSWLILFVVFLALSEGAVKLSRRPR